MTFTNEQMTKAKQAKSAEELLAMAKESGISITADEAAKYFAELHKEGELTDDELDAVAGGDKDTPDPIYQKDDRVHLDISRVGGTGNMSYNGTIVSVGPYDGRWKYVVQYDGRSYTTTEYEEYLLPGEGIY